MSNQIEGANHGGHGRVVGEDHIAFSNDLRDVDNVDPVVIGVVRHPRSDREQQALHRFP